MGREQDRYGGALGHIPGQPKHAWREGLCIRLIPVLLSGWSQARHSPATEGGIRASLPDQCLTTVPNHPWSPAPALQVTVALPQHCPLRIYAPKPCTVIAKVWPEVAET